MRPEQLSGYQVVLFASGAKSKDAVLGELGFNLGRVQGVESNCIAVVAHFEYTGEWKSFADEINWVYKDAAYKDPEALQQMKEQHGLYGEPPYLQLSLLPFRSPLLLRQERCSWPVATLFTPMPHAVQ